MRRPTYLQLGNDKLGRSIWTWSLPAVTGCGSAPSEYCVSRCYALGFRRFRSVMTAHARNHELALDSELFETELGVDLAMLPANSVVRVHVAGDFFSPSYGEAWCRLIGRFPNLTFYGYTRAWTDESLTTTLTALRMMPNARLWASTDWTMSDAPPGWPEARVFPSIDEAVARGYIVCPEQLGSRDSCEQCQLCWRIARDAKYRLAFIDHAQLRIAGEGKHSSPVRHS